MRLPSARRLLVLILAGIPACSLFVSLDNLQENPGLSDAGGGDGQGTTDGSISDARGDAPVIPDDASDGAAADAGVFLDDFNRADSPDIGNGWTAKNPAVFILSGGAVQRTSDMTTNFSDDIVYRPASEDVADVDLSVEFAFQGTPGGYPQLHARAQRATIATPGVLDAYICYVSDTGTLAISRTYDFTNLEDFGTGTISPPIQTGERYRLHCRVTGSGTVSLVASIEHFTGGSWVLSGQTSSVDTDAGVMINGGSVGFSASSTDSSQYIYDNFIRTFL